MDRDVEMGVLELLQVVPERTQSGFLRMLSSKSLRIHHIDTAIAEEDYCRAEALLLELLFQEYPGQLNGDDIDTLLSSKTLITAAERGDHGVVRLLLKVCSWRAPDRIEELLNGDPSGKLWTALHWACEIGHLQVARVLLDPQLPLPSSSNSSTASRDSSCPEFSTPLHLAIRPLDLKNGQGKEIERVELVKLLLQSPVGNGMLNRKDWQGNTPLHLAVETMNVDVVELLIREKRLIGTEKNGNGKTPSALNWEQAHSNRTRELEAVKIIENLLSELRDVQKVWSGLIDERTRYSNAAMDFLLIGALLVSVTYAGILSMVGMPDQLMKDLCADSPQPASVASVQPCIHEQAHAKNLMRYKPYYIRVIDIFRGSNNLSFFFAIITIMVAIRLIVSSGEDIPLENEISHMKNKNILISLALTFSTTFTVIAFISGALAKIPVAESGWAYVLSQWVDGTSKVAILKSTMLTTSGVGLLLSSPFIFIHLYDNLAILRACLGTKVYSWDSYHARWAVGRWQRFLTLFFSVTFLLATLFIVFMLIFGFGLLKDYIKPPPTN
ncbi:hypothetical protein R1flu_000427 [Riccia fluitans]|uniref:PGG domain-containing protein n=1 Tax=Riccia fluitans TaxID=41844 RepID=A0ABD1Y3K6_9MARC